MSGLPDQDEMTTSLLTWLHDASSRHPKRFSYKETPQFIRQQTVKQRRSLCLHRISEPLRSIGCSSEDNFSYAARSWE